MDEAGTIIIFGFLLIFYFIIFFYPGLKELKLNSDPRFQQILIPIVVTQCCGFYLFYCVNSETKISLFRVMFLIIICILISIISPYWTGSGSDAYRFE